MLDLLDTMLDFEIKINDEKEFLKTLSIKLLYNERDY